MCCVFDGFIGFSFEGPKLTQSQDESPTSCQNLPDFALGHEQPFKLEASRPCETALFQYENKKEVKTDSDNASTGRGQTALKT